MKSYRSELAQNLKDFLTECVVFGGYKCYIYNNGSSFWGYVIKDNYIISIQPYYGGFSYSFCYVPTRNAGNACQCFYSTAPIHPPRTLDLQTLEQAFEGGLNFAKNLNAKLYPSWLDWFNRNCFKNNLIEIKGL